MGNLSTGNGGNSYYDYARRQQVFTAYATVTAMAAYSTAAGTGGPLIWNNTGAAAGKNPQRVLAVLLAAGLGMSVASAAAGGLGITGNSGQTSAPTATTAIDAGANAFIGGPVQQCNTYRIGTVTNAGNFFMPFALIGTGALTVDNLDFQWFDLGGSIIVPPGSWASVAASVVMTTSVLQIGLMWAEIPY
jgi:hypothetical protein